MSNILYNLAIVYFCNSAHRKNRWYLFYRRAVLTCFSMSSEKNLEQLFYRTLTGDCFSILLINITSNANVFSASIFIIFISLALENTWLKSLLHFFSNKHLLVQSQQQGLKKMVWNMFKINNTDTRGRHLRRSGVFFLSLVQVHTFF